MNKSPYYKGFTTIENETQPAELKFSGTIPKWLRGSLIRTTPALFEVDGNSYKHWFDGLAMLYAFRFTDRGVSYSSRFLRGNSYLEAAKKHRISRGEFGTNPRKTAIGRIASFITKKLTDNCNVSINKFGNAFVALTETSLAVEFDPETLVTLGIYDYGKAYGDSISGQVSTAHPHFDFADNCHYTYVLEMGMRSKYRFFRIDAETGRQSILSEIPADRPAYTHTFGMSKNYLVFTENPLAVNPLTLLLGNRPFIRNYEWKGQQGVRFHIIDKKTGRVIKQAVSSSFFSFHHVNSFEKDGAIFADIVAFPDAKIIDRLYLENLRTERTPVSGKLMRFRIDPDGGSMAAEEKLSDENIEFPRINYRQYAGMPYRYVFGAGNSETGEGNDFLDSLIKLDLQKGDVKKWHRKGCYPGEPVFVSSPAAGKEDDGIVLSVVFDSIAGRSFLLVLNASGWKETAAVQLPGYIPFGFHGNFFSAFTGKESFSNLHR